MITTTKGEESASTKRALTSPDKPREKRYKPPREFPEEFRETIRPIETTISHSQRKKSNPELYETTQPPDNTLFRWDSLPEIPSQLENDLRNSIRKTKQTKDKKKDKDKRAQYKEKQ